MMQNVREGTEPVPAIGQKCWFWRFKEARFCKSPSGVGQHGRWRTRRTRMGRSWSSDSPTAPTSSDTDHIKYARSWRTLAAQRLPTRLLLYEILKNYEHGALPSFATNTIMSRRFMTRWAQTFPACRSSLATTMQVTLTTSPWTFRCRVLSFFTSKLKSSTMNEDGAVGASVPQHWSLAPDPEADLSPRGRNNGIAAEATSSTMPTTSSTMPDATPEQVPLPDVETAELYVVRGKTRRMNSGRWRICHCD